MSIAENISPEVKSIRAAWFDEFIASIKTHELMLETNVASPELTKMYATFMGGDQKEMAALSKINADKYFIKSIVFEYIKSIPEFLPKKLAFDLDDSEVLVWAEIKDDDEDTENGLLIVEAKINSVYHEFGYDVTTTIVEERDCLAVPSHYSAIL